MLTPQYLGKLPNNLIKTYEQLEEFIIDDICRRVAKTGEITSTAKWQVERAREMGIYTDVLEKKIAETLDKSYEEVDKLFEDAAIKNTEADNAIYEQAKLTPIHLNTSPELQEYLLAAVKQTKGELKNIAQSLGFCVRGVNGKVKNKKLTDMYIEALDLAQFQVSSGVLDYQTAVRNAVKKITSSGVRFINYESGYSNRIDVAVRRATLTGVNQMAAKMTELTMDELGIELVEVTAHAGARPSHAEWQGQVYCFKGKHPKYENLEEATGYGTGEGLCGWNCRHNFFPYVEGSPRAYSKEQLKNLDNPQFGYKGRTYTHYEAAQKQRQMETAIRKTKRELIGYNATGDKDAFTSASIKLQRQKQEYKAFSNKAKLPIQMNRTQEVKYGKSISQKAVWKSKKSMDNIEIKDKDDSSKKYINSKNVKEATEYAKNVLKIKNVNYGTIDIRIINEFNKGLYRSFTRFPELGKEFEYIGSCQEREKYRAEALLKYYYEEGLRKNPGVNPNIILKECAKLVKKNNYSVPDGVIAQSSNKKFVKGICINEKWGNYDDMRKTLEYYSKKKYFPDGCTDVKYLVDHELGHKLDDMLGISQLDKVRKLYENLSNEEITNMLSEYSWNNNNKDPIREFVAEAWAEHCNNNNERSIAQNIGEIIERRYKEWKIKR